VRKILLAFTVTFIICFNNCNSGDERPPTDFEIPVDTFVSIDIDKIKNDIDLKLSDLADSLKIIALETNPTVLLGQSSFYANDKYILAFDQNGIYKFGPDGKFIRKIISRGRGPEEVSVFTTYFVNEENNFIYLDDSQREEKFLVYDLRNERFLEPIKKCIRGKWTSFLLLNDSIIVGTTNNYIYDHSTPYALFYQNLKGDFISGLSHDKTVISCKDKIFQVSSLMEGGSTLKVHFNYNDTLFNVIDNQFIPYLAITYNPPRENPPNANRKNGDRFIFFPAVDSPGSLIIQVSITENFVQVSESALKAESRSDYYLFNKYSGNTLKVKSYTDNFIGISQSAESEILNFPKMLPNGYIVVRYTPQDIYRAVSKKLNYVDFPKKINDQLLEISKNLKETDNPILLIGRVKN
jgi:hypothetical protein